jgi:D-alanyl-lipoteichoic acid acyltransferase DltB (MBOAT superfamily)
MNVQSLGFFGFCTAVLVLYYFLSRKNQNYLLLIASYIFYASFSYQFAVILLIMTAVNYFLAKKIETFRRTRKWLLAGIGFNLMVFCFFKSAHFFVPEILSFISRLGLHIQTENLKIILPIGLSFYILQALSYLIDLYREQIPAGKDAAEFALYLAYFPKLTAGPIERAQAFLPKLSKQRVVDNELLSKSFTLIIIGLVRKILIADTLMQAVPPDFLKNPANFSSIELVAWLVALLVGIYNDFCGYTNIVRGISGLFGIELSRNFKHPLFSRNFTEFWNSWHISLSLWLRDYVYFPISRALVRRRPNRNNPVNILLPPVMAMLASGLWHDFSANFITWGVLMGLFLVGERVLSLGRPLVPPGKKPIPRQVLGTIVTVSLAITAGIFVFFTIPKALLLLKSLFVNTTWILPNSRVFLMFIPSLAIDIIQYRGKNELIFLTYPLFIRALLLAVALLTVFLFSQTGIPAAFVYQGF